MDSTTTVSQLKDQVKHFCEQRDWDQFHDPKELAVGLVIEASELLELFRFKDAAQQKEILANNDKRERVEEELADTLYFALRFAQLHNIDITKAIRNKEAKNNKKYPVHKAKGNNAKYDEL